MRLPGRLPTAPVLALLGVLFLIPGPASAEPILKADRSIITFGQAVHLELTVDDSKAEVGAITTVPQVKVTRTGTQNSVTVRNGIVVQKSSISYSFVPTRVGAWLVLPVTVTHNGKQEKTPPLQIVVQAPDKAQTLEITATVQPSIVYEGQPFALTARILHGGTLTPKSWNPPESAGVRDWSGQADASQKSYAVNRGDGQFQMIEIQRWMQPRQPGTWTMDNGIIEYEDGSQKKSRRHSMFNDPFGFGARETRRQRPIPPVQITVLPLPSVPLGSSFTGLIGDFQVSWQAKSRSDRKQVGILHISGTGSAPAPGFQDWSFANWKIYPQPPSVRQSLSKDGKTPQVQIDLPLTVVASQTPNASIPVYFSPTKRQYQTILPRFGTAVVQQESTPKSSPQRGGSARDVSARIALTGDSSDGSGYVSNRIMLIILLLLTGTALLVPLGFRLILRPGRPWQQVVQEALDSRDDHDSWEKAFQELEANQSHRGAPESLRNAIGEALFAPVFYSPRERIMQILSQDHHIQV